MNSDYNLLVVLGPTASGKTSFAARMAAAFDGEIISADSRQVYRGMTIGTGKDLADYVVDGRPVPYHLIDIAAAGEKYNVYRYQTDFFEAMRTVERHGRLPIMCGGTGLYIEAVLRGYRFIEVPPDTELRAALAGKTLAELADILASYRPLHNTSDTDTPRRAIRNIEIARYYAQHPEAGQPLPPVRPLVVGTLVDRETRRSRITRRLHARLREGLVDEVAGLMRAGVSSDDLIYYGLEYKFVTNYLLGLLTLEEMTEQLNIAIHQFAKRQMTWFRGMEARGIHVHWLDMQLPESERIAMVRELMTGHQTE